MTTKVRWSASSAGWWESLPRCLKGGRPKTRAVASRQRNIKKRQRRKLLGVAERLRHSREAVFGCVAPLDTCKQTYDGFYSGWSASLDFFYSQKLNFIRQTLKYLSFLWAPASVESSPYRCDICETATEKSKRDRSIRGFNARTRILTVPIRLFRAMSTYEDRKAAGTGEETGAKYIFCTPGLPDQNPVAFCPIRKAI